jgi:putative mRNA 3-end processing factor
MPQPADTWLQPRPAGLYCIPGDFHIDPNCPVDRALITHGHGDHARSGHGSVLATRETIEIMKVRYGEACAGAFETLGYGEARTINGVSVRFVPAGHILGSAQIVLEWSGTRVIASGDYKRAADPTCLPFELVQCDVFITEATFALPVFRHEPADQEIGRLLASMRTFPERAHLVGAYGLGKCQRILKLTRQAGFDGPIYLHGAVQGLTELYVRFGQEFGDLRSATGASPRDLAGALVLCPPSALADRWSRRFDDPVTAFASGWMRVRGRQRQRGVELPLVISDHADWDELLLTIEATGAGEIWVTHGREDALVHVLEGQGRRARALSLVGREDEAE